MKKLLVLIMMGLLMGCSFIDVPQYRSKHKMEQKTTKVRHYDQSGRYKGYSIIGPYNTRHYDENSRYKGKTVP